MAFSRVYTGVSVNPSYYEMKHEPKFKPLEGMQAFFCVTVFRGPFHLNQKTRSSSHTPVSEGRILLRWLWKVGLSLHSKTGNHSHPQTIWGALMFRQAALLKLKLLYT